MTATAPIPAAEASPSMANPSDTASAAPTEQAPARARATTKDRPSLRDQVAENPLLSFFGLMIIALLAAAITAPNIRINDTNARIDETNRRIDRLEDKVDARFDEMDARFDKLEAAVAEIDRKLTTLIAHLNATSAVDNALEGRITIPSVPDAAGMSDAAPRAG